MPRQGKVRSVLFSLVTGRRGRRLLLPSPQSKRGCLHSRRSYAILTSKEVRSMWKLLLKKLGMSFVALGLFVAGIFGYGLQLFPFLKVSETWEWILCCAFSLFIVSVVTVIIRVNRLTKHGFHQWRQGEAYRFKIQRIVMTKEFAADLIVFTFWLVGFIAVLAVTGTVDWSVFILRAILLIAGFDTVFGVGNGLLYLIACRRVDK